MSSQSYESQLVQFRHFVGLCRRVGELESELRDVESQLVTQRELLSALSAEVQRLSLSSAP